MTGVVVVGGIFREILDGDPRRPFRIGGSGFTAALLVGRLGVEVELLSFVGSEDAEIAIEALAAHGVDTEQIEVVDGASGTFVIPPEGPEDMPRPMYRPFEAAPSKVPLPKKASIYLVFGMPELDAAEAGWLDSVPRESMLLWDRQGWLSRARDSHAAGALPPRRRIYLANLREATEEFDSPDEGSTLAALPGSGFVAAVIKRGSDGYRAVETVDGDRVEHARGGHAVPHHTTIGSGDAFAAGLAARLAVGETLETSLSFANALAAAFIQLGTNPLAEGLIELATALDS